MKTRALLFSAIALGTAVVGTASSPLSFPDIKIEVPSFSLRDAVTQPPLSRSLSSPSLLAPPAAFAPVAKILPPSPSRFQMPVLVPDARVDYKLIVKAPDASVDYKLRIFPPASNNTPAPLPEMPATR